MKSILMALVLVASTAQSATSVRDPQVTETFQAFANLEDQGNGTFFVKSYDPATFDAASKVEELKKENLQDAADGDDCKMLVKSGRRANLRILKNSDWFGRPEMVKKLQSLYMAKKLKAAISNVWDGKSGESEYCAVENYYFYSNDGQVLVLNVDQTT